jgi:putative phosphoribosyl transferase
MQTHRPFMNVHRTVDSGEGRAGDNDQCRTLEQREHLLDSPHTPHAPHLEVSHMPEAPVLIGSQQLPGTLAVPAGARGLVLFAHGSGSSRHSLRNLHVAAVLQAHGLATLLFDLLNTLEGLDRGKVFDIQLLARRLAEAVDWAGSQQALARLPLGLFGASTGAAAALVASALRPGCIHAVVCRSGRPDLATKVLPAVTAPTLMIVGGADLDVLDLNQQAIARMRAPVRLKIIPGATHLFEEFGALDRVALLTAQWFSDHLPAGVGLKPDSGREAGSEAPPPVERRARAERRRWPRPAVSSLTRTFSSTEATSSGPPQGRLTSRPAAHLRTFRAGR